MGARPSSFAAPVTPTTPAREWSAAQRAIFGWFQRYGPCAGTGMVEIPAASIGPGEGEMCAGCMACSEPHLVIRARAGCLAGDTYITINRGGGARTFPIAELVAKFNGVPWPRSKGWDLSIPTMVQREQDGVIRLGRIKAAWASGVKQTYVITTESGRTIRATDEHPFMTAGGWLRLDELTVGALVLVRGEQAKPCSASKSTYSDESDMWNHPYAVVRPPDKTHPKGTARVATHRLVVEADRNRVEYQEFLWCIRSGQTDMFTFLDPVEWAVHHIDRDTRNNTIANLDVLTHFDHHYLHGLEDAMSNVLFKTTYEQIVAIEPFEMEATFDIEVEDDPHNFIANGFVVHNTGKTTTIIEGVNRAPEASILLCAFNKGIADELNRRIANPQAGAKTLHAIGMYAIGCKWRGINVAKPTTLRADWLTDQVTATGTPKPIHKLVSLLHTKGREMLPLAPTEDQMLALAYRFNLVPDEGWGSYTEDWVVAQALAAMHYAADNSPTYDIGIDFADMIYLPLVHDLLSPTYDLVVVDEAQDMSASQLEVVKRIAAGRICVVGDDKQAIYGFRGADSGSLDRLKTELGAIELPLTTSYRCCQAVIRKAQELVPDIQARMNAPEGEVAHIEFSGLLEAVQPGDFILSRLNAPLVSTTLLLLQKGKRARMAGRDIGQGIIALLRKLRCDPWTTIHPMLEKLDQWERKQTTRYASIGELALADQVRDQADTIRALAADCRTVAEIMGRCESLFRDEGDAQVVCSSVHKAKGLEADRVYLMAESLYRRGVTAEEANIEYVAVTRARVYLGVVSSVPGLRR